MTKVKTPIFGKSALHFAALSMGMLVLVHGTVLREAIDATYSPFLARTASHLLGLLGIEGKVSHATIILANGSMELAWLCNGVDVTLILACAIAATARVTPLRKVLWIAAGVLVAAMINLLRIVILGWVLKNFPSGFEAIHDILTIPSLLSLALFYSLFLFSSGGAVPPINRWA
ncbi:archaeosortase/exosortase family protein [Hydrogenimonas cancrithermarum]|uniref:Exosortase/archaeosortase family protein n=1 Tax=Hydrogenimonas cancrithermarum TaxID=2993563 RepID=A0ABN6WUB3_9BACT|nr:archaeosortase/exosortase family protein [Hydrogenimonas cancrithermarum]BDY12696.1 hypothetical protein HCR_10080 [Hydrogenimonas cancrithermarum]